VEAVEGALGLLDGLLGVVGRLNLEGVGADLVEIRLLVDELLAFCHVNRAAAGF